MNSDFITFCKNFNARTCTNAAVSPLSNVFMEQHDAVLGSKVTKTINITNCYLETAIIWADSAKDSLTNNNGFSPNQLPFSKNLYYPTIEPDLSSALKNKTSSELVQEKLNSLHSAQKNFIKAMSLEKQKRVIKHKNTS